ALADLSYRFVELPFRGKAKLPGLPDNWLRVARPVLIGAALAVVLFVGWSGLFGGNDENLERAEASIPAAAHVQAEPARHEAAAAPGGGATDTPRRHGESQAPARDHAAGAPAAGDQPAAGGTDPSAEVPGRPVHRPMPLPAGSPPPRIIALGDSVMIGAADRMAALLGPGLSLNAKEGRQASEFVEIVQKLRREGHDPDAMVIQMGNNGPLYGGEMEAIQKATAGIGELFLITDHAPVSWVEESNHALEEAAEDWPHTTLIDWAAIAAEHEDELWDGIHLKPSAAALYARLVNQVVRESVPYPRAARR
ncbi:MAG: hypothetical protein AB7P38_17035, partial [Solirubrobacterales bacterium]